MKRRGKEARKRGSSERDEDFGQILAECSNIEREYPGVIFIGGVAVHEVAQRDVDARRYAQASHDADFMVSLTGFSELRHDEEATANKRLGKHQIIRRGVVFDVYVERQHGLAIPYEDVAADAEDARGIHVACPEHLLVLKLNAYEDRRTSRRGLNDARHILILSIVIGDDLDASRLRPFLRPNHIAMLDDVGRGQIFDVVAGRNSQESKKLRDHFEAFVGEVRSLL